MDDEESILPMISSLKNNVSSNELLESASNNDQDVKKSIALHASIEKYESSSSVDHLADELSPFVIKVAVIASLGGVLFGYDMGVISGALPQLAKEFDLSRREQEFVVSVLYIGCGFGALFGGSFCDFYGRRKSILIVDAVFFIGAMLLLVAPSIYFVYFGRVMLGIAVAISGIADVAYLTEVAPDNHRGAIVSCNEACISIGFFAAYLAGYILSIYFPDDGWRFMFGLAGLIAVIQYLGMIGMPESPQWLIQQGKHNDAIEAIIQIYSCSEEFAERKKEVLSNLPNEPIIAQGYNSMGTTDNNIDPKESNVSMTWNVRLQYKQIMVAIILSVSQQFCGHGAILNFAPEIFAQAGFGPNSSLGTTLFLGFVKVVVTLGVIWKIDSFGRRILLLTGVGTICVSLLILVFAFSGWHEQPSTFVSALGCLGVVIGYASSFGPLTWLIVSEMFETHVRGRALGYSSIITYLNAALVSHKHCLLLLLCH